MFDLPGATEARLPPQPYNNLRRAFPAIGDSGLSLLNGLLTYDPTRRLSARAALQHPYFSEKPYPKRAQDMPTFPSSHEPGYKGVLQQRGPRASNPYDSPPPRPVGAAAAAAAAAAAGKAASAPGGGQRRQQRRAPPPAPEAGVGAVDTDGGRWGELFGAGYDKGAREAKRRRV
jgi:hypothetical protein